MNIQTKAIYVVAAAVVAHPLITKAIDGWGKYPSDREAGLACIAAARKGRLVKVFFTYGPVKDRYVRECLSRDNHWELV